MIKVAPLEGAWIEISNQASSVAPLEGAWIEINFSCNHRIFKANVAPLEGAWIEITAFSIVVKSVCGRTP